MIMRLHCLYLCLGIFCLSSCGQRTSEQREIQEETSIQEIVSEKVCFAYDHNDDLMGLTLILNGIRVSGQLVYALSEKDRSSGKIDGSMFGDTLIADYTFVSEGRISIREVVFLNRDNTFVEGIGDMEERDSKMVFKNRSALKFQNHIVLRSVPCHK